MMSRLFIFYIMSTAASIDLLVSFYECPHKTYEKGALPGVLPGRRPGRLSSCLPMQMLNLREQEEEEQENNRLRQLTSTGKAAM